MPEVDAAAVYYGYPPLEYIDASKIKIPLLGHFGTLDTFFPIAGVDALEQTLKAAGVRYTFHRYEARHAFANETAINAPIPIEYNPAAAELAWKRTLEFFAQTLEH